MDLSLSINLQPSTFTPHWTVPDVTDTGHRRALYSSA